VQKYGIDNMNSTNRCSRATGEIPRVDKETQDCKELLLVSLFHKESLIFSGELYLCPTFRIWTCSSRCIDKTDSEKHVSKIVSWAYTREHEM